MDRRDVRHEQSFYESATLRLWARRFAKVIPEATKVLVCASSSGMAIAAAVCTVRKGLSIRYIYPKGYKNMRSVSKGHSGENVNEGDAWVIVDDFIDRGDTAAAILEEMKKACDHAPIAIVVGSLCYGRDYGVRQLVGKHGVPVLFANKTPPILPKIKKECI